MSPSPSRTALPSPLLPLQEHAPCDQQPGSAFFLLPLVSLTSSPLLDLDEGLHEMPPPCTRVQVPVTLEALGPQLSFCPLSAQHKSRARHLVTSGFSKGTLMPCPQRPLPPECSQHGLG